MSSGALRRVLLVGLAYAAASLVVVGVAGWARTALALPGLFPRMLRGGLIGGLPIALLLAWHYPRIGHHGADPREEMRLPPRRSDES